MVKKRAHKKAKIKQTKPLHGNVLEWAQAMVREPGRKAGRVKPIFGFFEDRGKGELYDIPGASAADAAAGGSVGYQSGGITSKLRSAGSKVLSAARTAAPYVKKEFGAVGRAGTAVGREMDPNLVYVPGAGYLPKSMLRQTMRPGQTQYIPGMGLAMYVPGMGWVPVKRKSVIGTLKLTGPDVTVKAGLAPLASGVSSSLKGAAPSIKAPTSSKLSVGGLSFKTSVGKREDVIATVAKEPAVTAAIENEGVAVGRQLAKKRKPIYL